MVEPTFRGGDVALFIDWENFKISLAVGQRTPNLSSLKEEVSEYGRVVVSKAYADWVTRAPELRGASQFINDPPSLYAAGIEPVFVPTRSPSSHAAFANGVRTSRIKNSVDVKMTADCIECAHSYPNIGTFVLVSGDSDFIHVVNALRTMGKRVVVVGVSWSTSRRLADQVDSLILYDIDVEPLRPAVLPAAAPVPEAAPSTELGRSDLPEVIRAIEEIIRDERATGGNPLLTSIKQRLTRRYPNFDEKKLGFSGFKKLMGRAAEDGNIKLITAGLVDWAIMSDEETPEGAAEESPQDVGSRPSRRRGGRRPVKSDPQEEEAAAVVDVGSVLETEAAPSEEAAVEANPEAAPQTLEQPEAVSGGDEALAPERSFAEPQPVSGGDEALAPEQSFAEPQPVSGGDEALAPEQSFAEPQPVFGGDEALAGELEEALSSLSLPTQPEDGRTPERVSDLVVMADTLEHREGVSHIAFNFLVSEICDALQQGLEAEAAEITQRWGTSNSRNYVSRMLRGLSDGGFFQRGNHSWRDEEAGQTKRRRTFNLNRENPLVGRVLYARLGAPEAHPELQAETAHANGHEATVDDGESPGNELVEPAGLSHEEPTDGEGLGSELVEPAGLSHEEPTDGESPGNELVEPAGLSHEEPTDGESLSHEPAEPAEYTAPHDERADEAPTDGETTDSEATTGDELEAPSADEGGPSFITRLFRTPRS